MSSQRGGMLRTVSRTVSRAALLLLAASRVADAHAIHTTVTQLTVDATEVRLTIRAFADDISATVARHAGRPAPADFALPEDATLRYVRAQFMIGDGARGLLQLEPCGVRRAQDMYWLCYRARAPRGLAGMSVRNQILTEMHADQINIVQVETGAARQTLLFRKGSAPSSIRAGA